MLHICTATWPQVHRYKFAYYYCILLVSIFISVFLFTLKDLRNLIYHLCDPCGIALIALSSDDNCADAYSSRDTASVCTGRCRYLIDDIIENCDNSVS